LLAVKKIDHGIRLFPWSPNQLTAAIGAGAVHNFGALHTEGAFKTADGGMVLRVKLGVTFLTGIFHF